MDIHRTSSRKKTIPTGNKTVNGILTKDRKEN